MKSFLAVLVFAIASNALAASSSWVLAEKVEGPASFECKKEIGLTIDGNRLEMSGAYLSITNLNEGTSCSRRQNGGIFAHLRCELNTLESSADQILFTQQACGSDLPLIPRCNPSREEPNIVIAIDKNAGTLTLSTTTGWDDAPTFTCVYKIK